MGGFFFLPATPVAQEVVPQKGALLKKGVSQEGGDFSTFLEACCGNIGPFAVPPAFPFARACSSSATGGETVSLPCPLSSGSTVSLNPLALTCQGEEVMTDPLEQFSALLSDALEMVENFTVTLRLGEGNVTVSGLRGNDGNFSFSIEGRKEALLEFFTLLFENLRAWFEENTREGMQCMQSQCGCRRISCGDVDGTGVAEGESVSSLENVADSTPSSGVGSISETQSEPVVPLLPSLGEPADTPEGVFSEVSPLAEEESSNVLLEEASAFEVKEGLTKSDALSFEEESAEPAVLAAAPKKDQDQDNTPSFEEGTTQFFASVKGAQEPASQKATAATTSVAAENFAKVFEEVLRGVSEVKGRKEVVLHLEPEHLGSIVVRLEDQGGKIHCIWEVANPETRALLVKYLPILEAHLSAQGMFFENFLGDGGGAYTFWGNPWSQVPRSNQDEEILLGDFEVSQVNFLV